MDVAFGLLWFQADARAFCRGDEMGFSLRNDLLMMSGEMGDE